MARIGYAKIGRSWNLNPGRATSVGGDIDVINLLNRLAKEYPQHEFVLVGKNSGENPQDVGYPANVVNPWTEWKDQWKTAADPKEADKAIDNFRNIAGDYHETLDAMIVWAGQHGSANSRIPMIGSDWIRPPGTHELDVSEDFITNMGNDIITGGIGEDLATPQFAFIHYVSWLLDFISRWREAGGGPGEREEIWLCPDPRNYLKCREKRWPIRYPVLAQYDFLKYHKSERFGRFPDLLQEYDPTGYKENSLWVSNVAYCYSGLELTAVSDPQTLKFDPIPGPHKFGMVVNENLTGVADSRLQLLKSWVLPNFPDAEIRGHWTEKSQLELNRVINPVPYTEVMGTMKSFSTTLTTPASGSGWATAKPWEAFALGSVCFFHPRYDDQGHILPNEKSTRAFSSDAEMLGQYLRVSSPQQLAERVEEVTSNPDLYYAIVTAQRRHYEDIFRRWKGGVLAVGDRIEFELNRGTAAEPRLSPGIWTLKTEPPAPKVASRVSARPRGTNEERKKKKPPISRRKALRGGVDALTSEPPFEEKIPLEAYNPEFLASVGIALPDVPAVIDIDDVPVRPKIDLRFGYAGYFPSVVTMSYKTDPATTFGDLKAKRESKDEYFLQMAEHVATRSTCARRAVGTVLVNDKGHVLATGYNGVPQGYPHCNEGHECSGAKSASGTNLDGCLSAHSEQNAFLQCKEVDDIDTIYVTTSCCMSCTRMAMNTGARRIVFREEYPQPEAKELWLSRSGNEWIKLEKS